jgi:hypothetical protein
MLASKPSTRLHEVIDSSYQFPMVVFTGSRTACNGWWVRQPAQKRQVLKVRVAGR